MTILAPIIDKIREKISQSHSVVIFFDDDVDGVSSYLQIRSLCVGEVRGVIIKSSPSLKEEFASQVRDADLVIVLDKPMIEEAFFDSISTPIIWIDHHEPQHPPSHVVYLNPRLVDSADNRCTSYWAYKVVQKDLWLACLGCIADWQLTDVTATFASTHAFLLNPSITDPARALFDSEMGRLVHVLTFNLKGRTADVKKSIRTIEKLTSLDELVARESKTAKHLWQRYLEVAQEFDSLLVQIESADHTGPLLFSIYEQRTVSLTTELSNALLYRHPDKLIFIARLKSGEYKCSLRSSTQDLPKLVASALEGLRGYGGGHLHACGACVDEHDFPVFVERVKELVLK